MQKFSACRKRCSSIHFFSSTTMRCIMAIWPAGPPKLMRPILSQTLKNSPKLEVCAPTEVRTVSVVIGSRHLGGPVVPLLRGKAEIGEQPIVDHEALSQQAMIMVAGQRREPERNGVQAGGLRREV